MRPPQYIIYPELIGVCESERNASSPNSQSIALIFQLDADLYRNLSKRPDLWQRTVTFTDPVFVKIDYCMLQYRMKIGWRRDQQNFRSDKQCNQSNETT